jgi:2,4-dienoyl-CoA reductase-like NADH-dependent reductase (Old Yellow Enzyme family)
MKPASLFDPITLRGVEIPNRIVKSAMAEGSADADGRPLPGLARMYERWARGGVGLAITGMAHVRRGHGFTDHEIGLYDDALVEPLRAVPEAVHRHGGRVFAQLCHADPQIPRAKAQALGAVAPSAGLSRTHFLWNRAVRSEDLARLTRDFGEAARRAREAGFDGVQLHAAHGYLLSRMLSPLHNRRRDTWGGSFEGRFAAGRSHDASVAAPAP